jgi:hypothetical protein
MSFENLRPTPSEARPNAGPEGCENVNFMFVHVDGLLSPERRQRGDDVDGGHYRVVLSTQKAGYGRAVACVADAGGSLADRAPARVISLQPFHQHNRRTT